MTDNNLGEGSTFGSNTALGAGIGGFIGSWFGNGFGYGGFGNRGVGAGVVAQNALFKAIDDKSNVQQVEILPNIKINDDIVSDINVSNKTVNEELK